MRRAGLVRIRLPRGPDVCYIDGDAQGRDQTANAWSKQAQTGGRDVAISHCSVPNAKQGLSWILMSRNAASCEAIYTSEVTRWLRRYNSCLIPSCDQRSTWGYLCANGRTGHAVGVALVLSDAPFNLKLAITVTRVSADPVCLVLCLGPCIGL